MNARPVQSIGLLLCGLFIGTSSSAADPKVDTASVSPGASAPADIELRKLQLEEMKVRDEQERTKILQDAERRTAANEPASWMKFVGVLATPMSIIVSLGVGLWGYRTQSQATQKQIQAQTDALKVQFHLKAAEIAMDSRSTSEIENKVRALAALFPAELKHLTEKLDGEHGLIAQAKVGYGLERRETLIRLLAEHPTERRHTLMAWAELFPWDAQNWLKPILESEHIAIPK